ncbi:cation:proton antiporter domain-containing protein [Amycolatopsis sp. NBC_01286]|uniref:cation:proton antiporter domain-containing protein n=1 Tax=Amycolatopsis sp. NBC_01286 TaxID=2903560 RepID=UPI002E118BB8|nr:cation:proton antiporter [Amycolatopsis sp. NBC_01286]
MTGVPLVFADLVLILVLARLCGAAALRLGQPPVIGEIVAGLLLGPTLFHGAVAETLVPAAARPTLSALANVGVALFMFAVGFELDHAHLRRATGSAIGLSVVSTLLPLGLGAGLGVVLIAGQHPRSPLGFVLFLGAAMAVTAFPVLARILTDRRLQHTALGRLALATASMSDVLAWALLTVVAAIAQPAGAGPWRLLLVVPFVAALVALRPVLRWALWRERGERARRVPADRLTVVFVGVLAAGWITEFLGLHLIFGAFLFGALLPRGESADARAELAGYADKIGKLLLPVYFVVAGLQVDLAGVGTAGLLTSGLILLVAVAGKFGGGFLGGRLVGLDTRDALGMGALMNTRGLTELVVLSVGLQLGVLSGALYSMMVVMAIVTTAMTGPLLSLFGIGEPGSLPDTGNLRTAGTGRSRANR